MPVRDLVNGQPGRGQFGNGQPRDDYLGTANRWHPNAAPHGAPHVAPGVELPGSTRSPLGLTSLGAPAGGLTRPETADMLAAPLPVERLVAGAPTAERPSGVNRSIGFVSAPRSSAASGPARSSNDASVPVDLFPARPPGQAGPPDAEATTAARATGPAAGATRAEPGEKRPPKSTPARHHRPGAESGEARAGAGPSRTKRAKGGRRRRPTFWRELPMLLVVALLLTFLIQTFLARVYEIPSGSMEQTLHGCTGCTNDRVLVDKLSYRFGDPSPGDVIVFRGPPSWEDGEQLGQPSSNPLIRGLQSLGSLVGLAPPDEKDLIKRVIAVGGQTVACCDAQNRVTVDGQPLNEPYIYYLPEAGPPVQSEFGPVKVPRGQLWVMGDSRNNSADSRVPGHGPIPVSDVIGKARFVVLPPPRIKVIDDTNPQQVALSAPSTVPNGTPLALGVIGVVPLTVGRRWWRRRRMLRRTGSDTVG